MAPFDEPKKTGILLSCSLGSLSNVKRQIKIGCDINEKDAFGVPAIVVAARINSDAIVKVLIEAGVDVNVKAPNGESVAYWAAKHNNKVMKQLAGLKENDIAPEIRLHR